MPKPPTYSTQQLKERGWTPAMIRDLLGGHDRERPSELRVGSRDRLAGGTVKLYLQDRVEQAETTQAFADAQARARVSQDASQQAADSRKAKQQQAIDAYVEAYQPALNRHPEAPQLDWHALWKHHLPELDAYQYGDRRDVLGRLSRAEMTRLGSRLLERHRAAFYAAYPEHASE